MSRAEFADSEMHPAASVVGPLGHGAPAMEGSSSEATGLLPSAGPSPRVPAPAASEGGDRVLVPGPVAPRLPRRIRFRWCLRCEARDRLHVHDVCQVCGTWSR